MLIFLVDEPRLEQFQCGIFQIFWISIITKNGNVGVKSHGVHVKTKPQDNSALDSADEGFVNP
jgi:hypothetical protein